MSKSSSQSKLIDLYSKKKKRLLCRRVFVLSYLQHEIIQQTEIQRQKKNPYVDNFIHYIADDIQLIYTTQIPAIHN